MTAGQLGEPTGKLGKEGSDRDRRAGSRRKNISVRERERLGLNVMVIR